MSENNSESLGQQRPIETLRYSVRRRPGMYFGTLDVNALHQLVCNVLDHALGEAVHRTCTKIEVVLYDRNVVSVRDDGPGIHIETDPETGLPMYQISPVEKWGKLNGLRCSIQASRFTLGLPVVNAVSSTFTVEVKRNGFLWRQQFAEGLPLSALERVRSLSKDEATGSGITFAPDYSIFDTNEFDHIRLARRLRELTYLIPGLTIALEDQRSGATTHFVEFFSKDGVSEFVRHLNRDYRVLHEPITINKTVELERDYKPLGFSGTFDIALQYADIHQPVIVSFMNGSEVEYGGPHIDGLIKALTSAIKQRASKAELRQDFAFHGFADDDFTCGLAAILSMQHPHPELSNSIYYVLSNPELEDAVSNLVGDAIEKFSETYPDQMRQIIEKCLANKTQRLQRRYEE